MINSDHLFQETTMENNEEESDHPIRKDENEINSLRPYEITQQISTGPLPEGEGMWHHTNTVTFTCTVTYGIRQRDCLQTNSKHCLFMLCYIYIIMLCEDTIV